MSPVERLELLAVPEHFREEDLVVGVNPSSVPLNVRRAVADDNDALLVAVASRHVLAEASKGDRGSVGVLGVRVEQGKEIMKWTNVHFDRHEPAGELAHGGVPSRPDELLMDLLRQLDEHEVLFWIAVGVGPRACRRAGTEGLKETLWVAVEEAEDAAPT